MSKLINQTFPLGTSKLEVPRGNNKGISLVALVITIIVIIILAGIGLNSFFGTTQTQALKTKALNEFVEVENAVLQRGQEHKLDNDIYPYIGTELNNETNFKVINSKTYGTGFYLVTPVDFIKLGVDSVNHEYVVNYTTGEVILIEPYIINNKTIFTKSDLLNEETGETFVDMAEYDEKNGVNKPILYSGMLPVKRNGDAWVVTTKDDPDWYDYSISNGGPARMANAMLLDGVTATSPSNRQYSNEEIRAMNISELEGFVINEEGSMFVWLPRYTYKEASDGSIKIVYSNLTKDYLLEDYIKSPSFYFGEYTGATPSNDNDGYTAGGKELSGLWISKYEAKYVD